jgi:hypothetical protein
MAYTVHDAVGRAIAGDPVLDNALKDLVMDNPGYYIINEATGQRVTWDDDVTVTVEEE